MTSRPELKTGPHLWRGLSALALFGLLAAVFLGAGFGNPVGFAALDDDPDTSITETLGYAMFSIQADSIEATGTEPFLVAFEIIDVVLVAALVAAIMLARREEGGQIVSALRSLRGGDD
jgi:NADH-quinone oxidoreductase subunit J